jgi:hypothetical protein
MLAGEKQIHSNRSRWCKSFSKVALIAEQAAIIFYDRLFELAPR